MRWDRWSAGLLDCIECRYRDNVQQLELGPRTKHGRGCQYFLPLPALSEWWAVLQDEAVLQIALEVEGSELGNDKIMRHGRNSNQWKHLSVQAMRSQVCEEQVLEHIQQELHQF
jgi:hypothetical protein